MRNATKDRTGRTLQDRIKEAAEDMGPRFDRTELRKAAGVTKASVSDWFTGKTQALKGETLVKAAAYLGVTPAWLGHGEEPKRRPTLYAETTDEVELLSLFRAMEPDQRVATLTVARLARPAAPPPRPPSFLSARKLPH